MGWMAPLRHLGCGGLEVLDLRLDPNVAREITARFTERNANVLKRRGLPVTPGTLTWRISLVPREQLLSFQRWRKLTLPRPWRVPMQADGPSERS
jgi:hypothetical protein